MHLLVTCKNQSPYACLVAEKSSLNLTCSETIKTDVFATEIVLDAINEHLVQSQSGDIIWNAALEYLTDI